MERISVKNPESVILQTIISGRRLNRFGQCPHKAHPQLDIEFECNSSLSHCRVYPTERTRVMKNRLKVILLSAVILLGSSAPAPVFGQDSSKTVTISRDTKVGGQALEKGNYTVKFAEGKNGEVVFLRGKREVVKVSYEATKLTAPAADTSVIYKLAEDGSIKVSRIEFKGMDTALVLK
jgi:hypothetical protein